MFRDEKLELKVGLFIGAGIFLMFMLVFLVSDLYVLKKGYNIRVKFDYVNGITENAPVRLAGVRVGEVKDINIYYDEKDKGTRVMLNVWVSGDTRVETDATARINTLGLLGEQYLEISPGVIHSFLKPADMLVGRNPVDMSKQKEYLATICGKLEKGEGTIGKLLMEDKIYNDLEDFVGDIKAHPWKLFVKDSSSK